MDEQCVEAPPASLDFPANELEVSRRVRKCFLWLNIRTLGDLVSHTQAELYAVKNFGATSMDEVKAVLARKGLELGQRPDYGTKHCCDIGQLRKLADLIGIECAARVGRGLPNDQGKISDLQSARLGDLAREFTDIARSCLAGVFFWDIEEPPSDSR